MQVGHIAEQKTWQEDMYLEIFTFLSMASMSKSFETVSTQSLYDIADSRTEKEKIEAVISAY